MEINRQSWHARIYLFSSVDTASPPTLCGYLFGVVMTAVVPPLFLLLILAVYGLLVVAVGPWWAAWAIGGYVGLAATVVWLAYRCDQSPAFLAGVRAVVGAWKRRVCPPVTWR